MDFVSKLDAFFFDHLQNITEFHLRADATGPLGLRGNNHADLALSQEQMPLLTSIYLENVFISSELVGFLVGHFDTLERISLIDCYGGINGLAEDGIYWERLFTVLSDFEPEKLRQFDVSPLDPPYEDMHKSPDLWETDGFLKCRMMLDQDPNRVMFPYRLLDDKYGTLFYDIEATIESFLGGDDEKAYNRLLSIIHGNASKPRKEQCVSTTPVSV